MHPVRIILAVVAVLLLAVPAAHATAPVDGRCPAIDVLWSSPPAGETWAGNASGLDVLENDAWVLRACEITLDPVQWAGLSRAERCELVWHEIGHLAMLRHTPSGLMAHNGDHRWFAPCHSVRERVRHDLLERLPNGSDVACGRTTPTGFFCRAYWGDARTGFSREARYRVRVAGDTYTMRRVRAR